MQTNRELVLAARGKLYRIPCQIFPVSGHRFKYLVVLNPPNHITINLVKSARLHNIHLARSSSKAEEWKQGYPHEASPAHLERFMRSLKSECLNRMIFFGEASLRRALKEFGQHFHHERNHQGLDNRIVDAGNEVGRTNGEVLCRPV